MKKRTLADFGAREKLFSQIDGFNIFIEMVSDGVISRQEFKYGDRPCIGCEFNSSDDCSYKHVTLNCIRTNKEIDIYTAIDSYFIFNEEYEFTDFGDKYHINELIIMYHYMWLYEGGYAHDENCPVDNMGNIDDFFNWSDEISAKELNIIWAVCAKLDWGFTKLFYVIDSLQCTIEELYSSINNGLFTYGTDKLFNTDVIFDEVAERNYVIEWSINHKFNILQTQQKWDDVIKEIMSQR